MLSFHSAAVPVPVLAEGNVDLHYVQLALRYARFFETEAIAILTMLVSRYKIEVKEEPEFVRESFDERKARILRATRGVTTTLVRLLELPYYG